MKLWRKSTGAKETTGRSSKDAGPEHTGVNSAATRVGIGAFYGAVGLALIGGVTGAASAFGGSDAAPAPVEYVATTAAEGVAVTYVTSWLQATQSDQELVQRTAGSKLPTAPLNRVSFSQVSVADAQRTEADEVVSVTVSALVQTPAQAAEDESKQTEARLSEKATAEEALRVAQEAKQAAEGSSSNVDYTVRYYQVPVHQGADGHVQVIGYPTPVPAPAPRGAQLTLNYPDRLDTHGELAQTIQGFLQAYAGGQGDVTRYLAPGSPVRGIDPAPYARLHLMDLRANQAPDDLPSGQTLRVLVQAQAELTSTEGDRQAITLALTLHQREGRWEVNAVDPSPLISESPSN